MSDWMREGLAATARITPIGSSALLGTAVLIEPGKLLTCRHVVATDKRPTGPLRDRVVVEFPTAGPIDAIPLEGPTSVDAAVLELADPTAARLPEPIRLSGSLLRPDEVELVGYPALDHTREGVWRRLTVHGPTAAGHVQIDWRDEGALVGHSGSPVVDAQTGTMVGLLVQGSEEWRFDRYIPVTLIRENGVALSVPWLIMGHADAEHHFHSRAKGQRAESASQVDLFEGRTRALTTIHDWLAGDTTHGQVLVVTGQPGAGKSAVISRAGLSLEARYRSDSRWRGLLFHARGATAERFRSACAGLIGTADFATNAAVIAAASQLADTSPSDRWVIVVDALDEAAARDEIAILLRELGRQPGFRVGAATRPRSAAGPYAPGSLLREFGITGPEARNVVDLDAEQFFSVQDLVRYSTSLLEQRSERTPAPPGAACHRYRADAPLRSRLATAIAARAGRNFLVAALISTHLSQETRIYDPLAPDFDAASLPSTVGEALDRVLATHPARQLVRGALTALAYAEGAGVGDGLWQLLSTALGYPMDLVSIDELRASALADYLLETTTEDHETVTRLFHQALVDQLLEGRRRPRDQDTLTTALLEHVRSAGGWPTASAYTRKHVADHAAKAGRLSDLFEDLSLLLWADLGRLNAHVVRMPDQERPPAARVMLRAGPAAYRLSAGERAGLLSMAAAHLGLTTLCHELIARAETPLVPAWSHGLGRPHTRLPGHTSPVDSVVAVPMRDGRPLIASAGADGTVLLWDPHTGNPIGAPLAEADEGVTAIAAVQSERRTLVVLGRSDGKLAFFEAETGNRLGKSVDAHGRAVTAVAALPMRQGRDLVVSGGADGRVRLVDPEALRCVGEPMRGDSDSVFAVAAIPARDQDSLVVSGGLDGVLCVWDPKTGEKIHQSRPHNGAVLTIVPLQMADGKTLVASAADDDSVVFWDPRVGRPARYALVERWGIAVLSAVPVSDGKTLVAIGFVDGTIVLSDPFSQDVADTLVGHDGGVHAIALIPMPDGRMLLASGGEDKMVRLWELETGIHLEEPLASHGGHVRTLATTATPNGTTYVLSGGDDGMVRLWDPDNGDRVGQSTSTAAGRVLDVAAVPMRGNWTLVASTSTHGAKLWYPFIPDLFPASVASTPDGQALVATYEAETLRLRDAATGVPTVSIGSMTWEQLQAGRTLPPWVADEYEDIGPDTWLNGIAVLHTRDGRALLVINEPDYGVTVWDPETRKLVGRPLRVQANSIATVPMSDGRIEVISGGDDRVVRLWDPETGDEAHKALVGHNGPVRAVAAVPMSNGQILIASGGDDRTVMLWDIYADQPLRERLVGHTGVITALAAVPQSNGEMLLASGANDSTIRLWCTSTGASIGKLSTLEPTTSMATVVDGLLIATGPAISRLAVRLPS